MNALMPNVYILFNSDYNQRRWVEYNDYLSVRSPNGDRVPPKWHGWIHNTYDD
jgi:NADH:ubiquinone oxidoreductase subunit